MEQKAVKILQYYLGQVLLQLALAKFVWLLNGPNAAGHERNNRLQAKVDATQQRLPWYVDCSNLA